LSTTKIDILKNQEAGPGVNQPLMLGGMYIHKWTTATSQNSGGDPMALGIAVGELNGDGTVSAEHALDFKMRATLHAVGQTSVPFLVAGTTTNPVFRPDMKGIASEEVKSIVNKKAGGLLDRVLGRKR